MNERRELNSKSSSSDSTSSDASGIPQQSRREMLGKLRKAAIAVPIATALAIKPGTAFAS
ncbi:MAG: hypothetical protein GY768_18340 [Planctomycetaceae bacterium]|nr:hypothetical protein [Planctomycetaceae bacterium]